MGNIWIYTKERKLYETYEKVAESLGHQARALSPGMLDDTLAQIVGMPGIKGDPHTKAPILYAMPQVMVMVGLSDGELDAWLTACRQSDLEPIALKAVLTMHNRNWTLYELVNELSKEAARLGK